MSVEGKGGAGEANLGQGPSSRPSQFDELRTAPTGLSGGEEASGGGSHKETAETAQEAQPKVSQSAPNTTWEPTHEPQKQNKLDQEKSASESTESVFEMKERWFEDQVKLIESDKSVIDEKELEKQKKLTQYFSRLVAGYNKGFVRVSDGDPDLKMKRFNFGELLHKTAYAVSDDDSLRNREDQVHLANSLATLRDQGLTTKDLFDTRNTEVEEVLATKGEGLSPEELREAIIESGLMANMSSRQRGYYLNAALVLAGQVAKNKRDPISKSVLGIATGEVEVRNGLDEYGKSYDEIAQRVRSGVSQQTAVKVVKATEEARRADVSEKADQDLFDIYTDPNASPDMQAAAKQEIDRRGVSIDDITFDGAGQPAPVEADKEETASEKAEKEAVKKELANRGVDTGDKLEGVYHDTDDVISEALRRHDPEKYEKERERVAQAREAGQETEQEQPEQPEQLDIVPREKTEIIPNGTKEIEPRQEEPIEVEAIIEPSEDQRPAPRLEQASDAGQVQTTTPDFDQLRAQQVVGATLDDDTIRQMQSDYAKELDRQEKASYEQAIKDATNVREKVGLMARRILQRGLFRPVNLALKQGEAARQLQDVLVGRGIHSEVLAKATANGPSERESKWQERLLFKVEEKTKDGKIEAGAVTRAARETLAKHIDANLLRVTETGERFDVGQEGLKAGGDTAYDRMRNQLTRNETLKKYKLDQLEIEKGDSAEKVNMQEMMLETVEDLRNDKDLQDPATRKDILENFDKFLSEKAAEWGVDEQVKDFFIGKVDEDGENRQLSSFTQLVDNLAQADVADEKVQEYINNFALYSVENFNTEGSAYRGIGEEEVGKRDNMITRIRDKLVEKIGWPVMQTGAGALVGVGAGTLGMMAARNSLKGALLALGAGGLAGAGAGGIVGLVRGFRNREEGAREMTRDRMQGAGLKEKDIQKQRDRIDQLFEVGEDQDGQETLQDYLKSIEAHLVPEEGTAIKPVNGLELQLLAERFNAMSDTELQAYQKEALQLQEMYMVLQTRMDQGYWSVMSFAGTKDISARQKDLRDRMITLYDRLATGQEGIADDIERYVNEKTTDSEDGNRQNNTLFLKAATRQVHLARATYVGKQALMGAGFGLAGGGIASAVSGAGEVAMEGLGSLFASSGVVESMEGVVNNLGESTSESVEGTFSGQILQDGDGSFEITYSDASGETVTLSSGLEFNANDTEEEIRSTLEAISGVDNVEIVSGDSSVVTGAEYTAAEFLEQAEVTLAEEYGIGIESTSDIAGLESAISSSATETVEVATTAMDIDGAGVPDQYVIDAASVFSDFNTDSLAEGGDYKMAVVLSEDTGDQVLYFDVTDDGQVIIPDTYVGLLDENGNLAASYTALVAESSGGEMEVVQTVKSGDGIESLRVQDSYQGYQANLTLEDGTVVAVNIPGVETDVEVGAGLEADWSHTAAVSIYVDGELTQEDVVFSDYQETANLADYDQSEDPYYENKEKTNAFGPNANTGNAAEIVDNYIKGIGDSPEQLAFLYVGLDLEGAEGSEEWLNNFADEFAAMDAAEQAELINAVRDALIDKIDGGSVSIESLADSPASASSYITEVDGNLIAHTYQTTGLSTDGYTITFLDSEGNDIFDTEEMRQLFGISEDASGHFALRLDCGYQFMWIPDDPETSPPTITPPVTDPPYRPPVEDPPVDGPPVDDPPGLESKGENTNAGDNHEQLGTTPSTDETAIGSSAGNYVDPNTTPGSEVQETDESFANITDADTATSEETTSQYNDTTENWAGAGIEQEQEEIQSNANEGSVYDEDKLTDYSNEERGNIADQIAAETARQAEAVSDNASVEASASESPASASSMTSTSATEDGTGDDSATENN